MNNEQNIKKEEWNLFYFYMVSSNIEIITPLYEIQNMKIFDSKKIIFLLYQ